MLSLGNVAKGQVGMKQSETFREPNASEHAAARDAVEAGGSDGLLGRKGEKGDRRRTTLDRRTEFSPRQHGGDRARGREFSKATLYAYFPSKNKLFEHLIVTECREFSSSMVVPDLDLGLAEALRRFARQYVRLFVDRDPKKLAFFHTLLREVVHTN